MPVKKGSTRTTPKVVKKKLVLPDDEVTDFERKLTVFDQLFVNEYLIDCNATAAAMRAGAPKDSALAAGKAAWMNVEVRRAIKVKMDERAERLKIDQDRVVEELKSLALSNILDYAIFDGETVCLRGSQTLGRNHGAAIKSVKSTPVGDGDKMSVEIVLHDKVTSLKMLGQHLGILGSKSTPAGNVTNNTVNFNGEIKNYADLNTDTLRKIAKKIADTSMVTVEPVKVDSDE